jgi:hypothetical protein
VTKVFENGKLIKEISAEVEAKWEADMPSEFLQLSA